MLKKRIIPCLDIKNGRTVKGTNFLQLKDAGNPLELAQRYAMEGADELVFLDIAATEENRKTLLSLVTKIAQTINIPFTVGGGIQSVNDAKLLINAGADKISINTAAMRRPELISELAKEFGSQCVVLAVDALQENKTWKVSILGAKQSTNVDVIEWIMQGERLGAGEILLTSINQDGMKRGFEIDLLMQASNAVNIPIIASGGAGSMEHFKEVFEKTKVSAALAASIFHFAEINILTLKQFLKNHQIAVR